MDQGHARPVRPGKFSLPRRAKDSRHHRLVRQGTPGGMFAPTLLHRSQLGRRVGDIERFYFPHLTGSTGTYVPGRHGVSSPDFYVCHEPPSSWFSKSAGNYEISRPRHRR